MTSSHPGHAFRHVGFTATDVPALGYKVYKLRHIAQPALAPAAVQTTTLESPYYKVTLDATTGSVTQHLRQAAQQRAGEPAEPLPLWPVSLRHRRRQNAEHAHSVQQVTPHADLTIHSAAAKARYLPSSPLPSARSRICAARTSNTPSIETEILLFDHEKKIELIEHIDKTAVTTKEAAYFAFPFAMAQPQFQYEIQTGVVDPSKDQYAGAGHEWFTVQHWVAAQQDGASAAILPLDAPLVTLGDINRGLGPLSSASAPEPSSATS